MKMTYRDRMIALIVVIIALILAGIFIIVKPTTTKISNNKSTLASVEAQKTEIEDTINKIPSLEESIKNEYNESKTFAEKFTDSRDTYQADQFVQEYFNNNKVEILSLSAEEATNETIEFYMYEPNVVTYPLLEAADLNGDIATATAEKLKTSTVLSSLESQEVEMYTLQIQFYGKKSDILTLIDNIKDVEDNIIITDFSIDDYTFGAKGGKDVEKDYSTGSMTLNFYVLEPLAEPVLG